uniref:Uncharacterized protein n=1 Tax=Arundo donax TaxID=35708 RepID=A0A0A9E1J5_ARUDO
MIPDLKELAVLTEVRIEAWPEYPRVQDNTYRSTKILELKTSCRLQTYSMLFCAYPKEKLCRNCVYFLKMI